MAFNLSKVRSFASWAFHNERFHYERGRILALWAGIENHLDYSNAEAWEFSDRTISEIVPVSLSWKVKLFKRIHRDLLPYKDLQKEAREILNLIKAREDDRHWLAHAMLVPLDSKNGQWALSKTSVDRNTGELSVEKRTYTTEQLDAVRDDLKKLTFKMLRYRSALTAKLKNQLAGEQSRPQAK